MIAGGAAEEAGTGGAWAGAVGLDGAGAGGAWAGAAGAGRAGVGAAVQGGAGAGGTGPAPKRLYEPRPVAVRLDSERVPVAVAGVAAESVREQWVVEDRWWEAEELRRAYFELALADGRVAVVYRCAVSDRWYGQRA